MAALCPASLINLTTKVCRKQCTRGIKGFRSSRITKFKNPFVGGPYKKETLPLKPRGEDEYAAEGESLYPDIPGEYPPGAWGKMDRERAWKFYARGQELLERKGSLRERLYDLTKVYEKYEEKQTSKEAMKHWTLEPSRERPYFFPFVQYVTKTRLHRTLPSQMIEPNPNVDLIGLKQRLADTVELGQAKGECAEVCVEAIVDVVNAELLSKERLEHLVEGQLDRGIVFEAGWRRAGFEEDDMEDDLPRTKIWRKCYYANFGDYKHLDPGIINFQGRASPFLSLRSSFPLKGEDATVPLVAMETTTEATAAESKEAADQIPDVSVPDFVHEWVAYDGNSIPLYAYHPSLYGLKNKVAPPALNAGFFLQPVFHKTWIEAQRNKFWTEKIMTWNAVSIKGRLRRVVKHHTETYHPGVESDPRGFPHTAFLLPSEAAGADAMGYSFEDDDDDPIQQQQWDAERMLTTLFTWNLASAYYQGFCSYLDLTYPIESQGVLTDGSVWQFFLLRTDTMELWRDDDAYSKGSTMWMSRKLKMEEEGDLILTILSNFLSRETRREMSLAELQPFVTKTDEIVEAFKPKYDFEMKVL